MAELTDDTFFPPSAHPLCARPEFAAEELIVTLEVVLRRVRRSLLAPHRHWWISHIARWLLWRGFAMPAALRVSATKLPASSGCVAMTFNPGFEDDRQNNGALLQRHATRRGFASSNRFHRICALPHTSILQLQSPNARPRRLGCVEVPGPREQPLTNGYEAGTAIR